MAGALDQLATKAGDILDGDERTAREVKLQALKSLSVEQPAGKPARRPFHWALEFPEVFENGGFNAFVGNPPYGGKNTISNAQGANYVKFISHILHTGAHGNSRARRGRPWKTNRFLALITGMLSEACFQRHTIRGVIMTYSGFIHSTSCYRHGGEYIQRVAPNPDTELAEQKSEFSEASFGLFP